VALSTQKTNRRIDTNVDRKSSLVPKANFVLTTSPEKFQVVWKVEGMTLEEAKALLHALWRLSRTAKGGERGRR